MTSIKKKKGLRQNSGRFFSQFCKFKRLRGGSFRMGGGAIFHFSQKIGLKITKNMRFCILHKPMGGARAPPHPPWLRYCPDRMIQARRHVGRAFQARAPPPPNENCAPPSENCAPKKLTGSGLVKCEIEA